MASTSASTDANRPTFTEDELERLHAGIPAFRRLRLAAVEQDALRRMQEDEDMQAESGNVGAVQRVAAAARGLLQSVGLRGARPTSAEARPDVPLNWRPGQGGHRPNAATRRLFREAGGIEAIRQFTELFYQKCFANAHIDQFIRAHDDPHGERMATWLAEKFGEGTPWTTARATRRTCPFASHGYTFETPHDRSSAHFAAWHSPKRTAEDFGKHFKLDDCRVWMRLNFWAMRESGIAARSPGFFAYYTKFIGHFVSVYERTATQFARESARWSADPANIKAYTDAGNRMQGVIGVPLRRALQDLPAEEHGGARAGGGDWPYERA